MPVSTQNTDLLTASYGKSVALAYGRHWVGGNVILKDDSDQSVTTAFIALGEGEWDGIERLIVNGAEQDLNLIGATHHFHKGLPGELSSSFDLFPEGVGSLYPFLENGDQKVDQFLPISLTNQQGVTFSRTAYLALRIPFDIYAPSPDLQVVGLYRCRKVRIFNAGAVQIAYEFSDNPAWCIADLLTRVRGLADSRLDWASFVAAATYCAEMIAPLEGVAAPRFVCNVAFTEEVDFDTALDALLATCRGRLLDYGGTIKLRIDQVRASTFDFQDHDTAGAKANIMEGSFEQSYRDTRETPNRIELNFRDSENGYQRITKIWNHEPQQARTGRVISSQLELGNMPQHQAERLGNYLLTRAIDNNVFVRLVATPSSLAVMPGDVVRVKHDAADWAQDEAGAALYKAFEVLEVSENADETRGFLLRSYDDATYSDLAGPAQNLIGTLVRGRPPAPLPPELWTLFANLQDELTLRASVPKNTDWRIGDLTLLIDREPERVQTTLAAPVAEDADEMQVDSSAGFRVGDFVNFQREILRILGPGLPNTQPTSTTWSIARQQKLSPAQSGVLGDLVTRLEWEPIHWVLPPRYTLDNPTASLQTGPYYVKRFTPGGMRILYAMLTFSSPGGTSVPVELSFADFVGEPVVEGTLPGLRTTTGRLEFVIPGQLVLGANGLQPVIVPGKRCIKTAQVSLPYSDSIAPQGAALEGRLLVNGVQVGASFMVPEGATGSGTFMSGAIRGNVGELEIVPEITQVGSDEPGAGALITVYML